MTEEIPESRIWSVLDGLRNDRHEAGVALASLLYLRWVDFQEGELEAIAAFDGTDYEPVLPSNLRWRSWYDRNPVALQETLGCRLAEAIKQNKGGHNPLTAQIRRLGVSLEQFAQWDAKPLSDLVLWVAEQPFETPSDRRRLLHIFDSVLSKDSRPEFGEHRTPAPIAQVIASLAAPAPNERIYDPCFGSGGLLTAALDYLQSKDEKASARGATPNLAVFGVECNLNAFVIGLTRLALAGADSPHLELGNSLERMQPDNPQKEGFDVVVANPPWGGRVQEEILSHYLVRTNDTSGLFIQHALMHLRPGGRAVVVVPEGLLFRGGAEQRLRVMLTKEHTVEAVVGLSEGLFQPYTSIRTCILVVRRGGETKQIRMVDASSYFEPGKGRRAPSIQPTAIADLVTETYGTKETANVWSVDVEALATIDWDLTPRRRKGGSLTATLAALEKEVKVVPLSECCTIILGHSIRSEQHTERMPEECPVPFVRIRDIQRGEANKAMSWITPEAALTVDPEWKLRAGDVLLSKSGTIGKVGIVRNGALGGVPANGLYVLRPNLNLLDPHFLVAYLESSQCRAWLDDRARGMTIRHLSKSMIESLPVPVPALRMQQRVVEECREQDLNALEYLTQLLTEGERDAIAEWIEAAARDLSQPRTEPLDLEPLERIVEQVRPLRNKIAHGERTESPLVGWLLSFYGAASTLRGISRVPKGPGFLSLVQDVIRGIERSKSALRGNLPSEDRARTLIDLVAASLERAVAALATDVRLALTTDVATLKVGEMGTLELQVRNESILPLRDVHITTSPDWGTGEVVYLAEGGTTAVSLSGPTPKVAGKFTLLAEWNALTLDGQQVAGKREIAFDVIKEAASVARETLVLSGSPYVCGDPIRPDRNDVFFGREELIGQIRRQIADSGNVVLLEGNRRAGKSSILRHLEGKEAIPGWLGVYCSLQGAEGSKNGVGVPTVEIFREMANSIAKGLQSLGGETPLPNGQMLAPGQKLGIAKACREGIGDAAPFSDFRDYAEVAFDMLKAQGLGLLLMLDEFDKLQEGIDHGVTSPQVPENIRFLVQTYPTFSAILTGSRRLKRLREEYWSALFGLGTRFGVTSLSEEAARHLITEPVKGRLTYSGEAVKRAIELTAAQPYLLQCLCSRIFDMAAQLKTRSITLDIVNQAGKVLVVDNEHFASLWDYARSDRRRFILALCHKESERPDTFRLGVIQERLSGYGIEIDDETLIADLEALRELELIELREGQTGEGYALAIPLMGAWIDHQQDFTALQRKAQIETEDQNG